MTATLSADTGFKSLAIILLWDIAFANLRIFQRAITKKSFDFLKYSPDNLLIVLYQLIKVSSL